MSSDHARAVFEKHLDVLTPDEQDAYFESLLREDFTRYYEKRIRIWHPYLSKEKAHERAVAITNNILGKPRGET